MQHSNTSYRVRKLSRGVNTISIKILFVNDPSAGSPTETLLRLLLPLNDKIYSTSREAEMGKPIRTLNPWYSSDHSIGRSDGRCVQRAGT